MGFAKSFAQKSHFDDLLSVPDLAAGVVQELLQSHKTGDDQIPGGEGKVAVMKWITRQSDFLSKITIQIVPLADGTAGVGTVDFTPADQADGKSG